MIRDTIKSIFTRGSFTQDVLIISAGKIVVTIIGFIFIPILSRIYTPEAYGNFSIYYAIVTLLVTLYTLAYPAALIIAKDEKTFYNLFSLSSLLTITLTSFTFVIILIFGLNINNSFHVFNNSYYLFLVPVGILLNGFLSLFTPWNIRRKQFVFSSTVAVSHNLLIRIFNLIIGLFTSFISIGLIIGNQLGRFIAVFSYFLKYYNREKQHIFENFTIKNIINTAKEYRNYPLYILPSQLVRNLKDQSAIYFIGFGFGKSVLGNFSIAVSLLNIPIQIIANSMSGVFLEKANKLYLSDKNSLPYFIQDILTKLFVFFVIPFSILGVFGKEIVILLLGDQWLLAGNISALLGPYFFTLLIISPIIPVLQIFKKEKQLFLFNFSGLILNLVSLVIGIVKDDIELLIILYTISNVILYLTQCIYIFKLNNLPYWRIAIGFLVIYPTLIILLTIFKNIYIY
jgi:O-antigen/teichoic acid export membrane protein